mmetsp:Transcript_17273/g.40657  ORF Transcript_17273/g.40657 Transcript_17273/m.40657 type:complete len:144 (-) Transcript_17273:160-591(-)
MFWGWGKQRSPVSSRPEDQDPKLISCCRPVSFTWRSKASEVFVVGSFTNWGVKVRLAANPQGEFSCVIQLPPGLHTYKFIVDGEWKCSDGPRIKDPSGNENNCVTVADGLSNKKELPSTSSPQQSNPKSSSPESSGSSVVEVY